MSTVSVSSALLSAVLVLSTYAVPFWPLHKAVKASTDPEAYRVYAVALSENLGYERATPKVLIRQQTRAYLKQDCFSPSPRYKSLVEPAIASYYRVNGSRWKLDRLFPIPKPYELFPESDFTGFWWKPSSPLGEYVRKDPCGFAGVVELSAVGFNADKTIAVVYTAYKRGVLSSGWDVIILQKQKGEWKHLIGRGLQCRAIS